LFFDLRQVLTAATLEARSNQIGLWPRDRTNRGFRVESLDQIQDIIVMLPKLFRRMAKFLDGGGTIDGFKDFLKAAPDPLILLDRNHFTNLDNIVDVRGNRVKLLAPPEQIVFIPQ
jgi:hypothetical protein